jgi:hypothetical protein
MNNFLSNVPFGTLIIAIIKCIALAVKNILAVIVGGIALLIISTLGQPIFRLIDTYKTKKMAADSHALQKIIRHSHSS